MLEDLFERAYLPLVECLERHPRIKAGLHYTGFLLDHLRARHPDFIDRVRALAAREQVELLGGGLFEPILPAIPARDRQRQLRLLREEVEETFGRRPAGLWLAERVWEPSLPRDLADAGYEYTILDDAHFASVGIVGDRVFDYYQTEDEGRRLKLLITQQALRYSIPWHDVADVVEQLRAMAADEPRFALMGDDGEKFGGWPGTHEKCWTQGWMDHLLDEVEGNTGWLETVLPQDYIRRQAPAGLVYLPPGSYPEMQEWSGGFWRNFLVRYPEVNLAHKKMLRVSEKLARAYGPAPPEAALRALLRGQSNDAYWHGVFGGAYLPHLRHAVWESLLEAEATADDALHPRGRWQQLEQVDHDYDGSPELLVENDTHNVYLSPARGGAVVEWDVRGQRRNLVDCMRRRPEPYHERLRAARVGGEVENIHETVRAKEPGLEKRLVHDRRGRLAMHAYLVSARTAFSTLRRAGAREVGDFGDAFFSCVRTDAESGEIVLARQTRASRRVLRMEKRFQVDRRKPQLEVAVRIELVSGQRLPALLLLETNLGLFAGVDDCWLEVDGSRQRRRLDRPAAVEGVSWARLRATGQGDVCLRLGPTGRLWYYPVETVNNSEGGFERILQGGCFTAAFPVELVLGKPVQAGVSLIAEAAH